MRQLLISIAFFLLFISCRNREQSDSPECLKSRISEFQKTNICGDAKVDEYVFRQHNVYVFDAGSCIADGASEVTDDQCNTLGYLGGITGNQVIDGENFGNAVLVKTVWKNH